MAEKDKSKITDKKIRVAEIKEIVIPAMNLQHATIRITGDSDLIMNRFGEVIKDKLREKEGGHASAGRGFRRPDEECESALYKDELGNTVFPAIAFKCAAVKACTSLGKTISKVAARQSHHVDGTWTRIEGKRVDRCDTVRLQGKSATLRYRPSFVSWSISLPITFNANVISLEQLVNLYNTAGFAVGVGEWRPEKNGQFGRFHVSSAK